MNESLTIQPSAEFPHGIQEASLIMQEVATWLIETGKAMWSQEKLTSANLLQDYRPEEIYLGMLDRTPCLAFVLQEEDPLFWPHAKPGEALYLHKLAVSRKYKGQKLGAAAIDWCKDLCRSRNRPYLRLDCDPNREGLVNLYTSCGFKQVDRRFIGSYDTTFFEVKI